MLFVFFDCLILVINYQITYAMEKNALTINVAGRQRMLTQQQAKVLLEIKYRLDNNLPINNQLDELKNAHEQFTETLNAFAYGGTIKGANNAVQFIDKINDELVQSIIEQAQIDMTPMSWTISQFLLSFNVTNVDLDLAIDTAAKQSNILRDEMERLTSRIQQLVNSKTRKLRWFQGAFFAAGLVNFLFILWLFHQSIKHNRYSIKSLTRLINSINHAILGVDKQGKIIMNNNEAMQMFGYSKQTMNTLVQDALINIDAGGVSIGIRADGGRFPVEVQTSSINMLGQQLELVEIRDISKQLESQLELTRMASRDTLTDAVNRRVLFDRLEIEIAHSSRDKTLMGVVFIDLDHFKPVNDNYGHSVGDRLLKQVAERLNSQIRAGDTLARYGGDEFVILFPKLSDKKSLERMARTIIEKMAEPFQIDRHVIYIGVSLGLVLNSARSCLSGMELLRYADHAMYQAKRAGGNTYVMASLDSSDEARQKCIAPLTKRGG
jgi:diguanylate cyclase (GGDEF)-like protein